MAAMWNKKRDPSQDDSLHGKFTLYLTVAAQRQKRDYLLQAANYQAMICPLVDMDELPVGQMELDDILDSQMLIRIQNEALLQSLLDLSERDRYVLLNRALERKDFRELSKELGLSYQGVASIYYRTIQRVRRKLEGKKDGFR